MIRRSSFKIAIILVALAMVGFGCKKPDASQPPIGYGFWELGGQVKPRVEPPKPYVRKHKPDDKGDNYVEPEIRYLQQVLKNFTNVQSFRASLKLPASSEATDGVIEFARRKGLHATLRLPDGSSNELTFIKQNVYFRSGTSTEWTNIGGTDEGIQMTILFISALNLSPSSTETMISPRAKIISVIDDPSGCKRYTFMQRDMQGEKQTSYVCVQNELPMIVGTVSESGNIETVYRDYNQEIEIKNPTIK